MLLRQIFDPYLAQYSYLIGCQKTGEALIIDPERDIDRYQELAAENGLRITAVSETHIHADFVSGAREFSQLPGVTVYLSDEGGADWSYKWSQDLANVRLLKDGDSFYVGNIRIEAVHTPGHTPEHLSFLITDLGGGANEPLALATGDFLFVGDVGRPDLLESAAGVKNVMEPSARTLRASLVERLKQYGDYLQILPGHGAGSACGKSLGAVPVTTLGYERRFNAPFKLALENTESFIKEILHGQPEPPAYFATMKRDNRDGIPVTHGIPKAAQLSPATFQEMASDKAIRILDTRMSKDAFAEGHMPRAICAPLHSPFFSVAAGSFLDAEDKILLVLEKPIDADIAIRQLYRIGFDNIVGWITVDEARDSGLLTTRSTRVPFSEFTPATAVTEGIILDVRSTVEYQGGHLTQSLSIPYTRLKTRVAEVPKEKRIFVHCASGRRASLAASFLESLGYHATHVDGAYEQK
jgi:hydroxyacylglutathione hydrolase